MTCDEMRCYDDIILHTAFYLWASDAANVTFLANLHCFNRTHKQRLQNVNNGSRKQKIDYLLGLSMASPV